MRDLVSIQPSDLQPQPDASPAGGREVAVRGTGDALAVVASLNDALQKLAGSMAPDDVSLEIEGKGNALAFRFRAYRHRRLEG